jgi:hypothetical protein
MLRAASKIWLSNSARRQTRTASTTKLGDEGFGVLSARSDVANDALRLAGVGAVLSALL